MRFLKIGIFYVTQMEHNAEFFKKSLWDTMILPFQSFQTAVNSNQAKTRTTALFSTERITYPQNGISSWEEIERA